MRSELSGRARLIEAVANINKILTDTRIDQHQRWYSEQKLLEDITDKADSLSVRMVSSMTPLELSHSWPDEMETLPNKDLLAEMRLVLDGWRSYVAGIKGEAEVKLRELLEKIATLRDQWETRFELAETVYRGLGESLDTEGVGLQVLSQRRRDIQRRIHALNEIDQGLQSETIPRIMALKSERERLLTELQNSRRAITGKREGRAKELSVKLNQQIRL